MIAGSVANNVGLSCRQLHLIPVEKCADCRFAGFRLQVVTINRLSCILSPDGLDGSLVIQQDVFVYYYLATSANSLTYTAKSENRRIFIYLIAGDILINTEKLTKGDGCGLIGYRNIELTTSTDAEFLLFDLKD